MSTQELLTFLFNAIALGFITIASMDFGTRLVVAYKQVSIASISLKKQLPIRQLPTQLPLTVNPQELPQLPDPWLSLPVEEAVVLVKVVQKEQKHLQLPPPVKEIKTANPLELADNLLEEIDLNKMKLRQARKVAKVLGIAQKVKGRDLTLVLLLSQIKLKLQQVESETVQVVKRELLAC